MFSTRWGFEVDSLTSLELELEWALERLTRRECISQSARGPNGKRAARGEGRNGKDGEK